MLQNKFTLINVNSSMKRPDLLANKLEIFFQLNNLKGREVSQSCLTLCDPGDCSPPGSSVHGILQARILEWVAISFSYVGIIYLGRQKRHGFDPWAR